MNQKGQISFFLIFFFLSFVSGMVMLIHLGLLVKARINLQNATDAAAFSGASVQARYLSKIAWLNFEMRNNYKELMFKYYVLGSLNTIDGQKSTLDNNQMVDFRVKSAGQAQDQFNFPSICLFFAKNQKGNICSLYSVAGIPKFADLPIPGAGDTLKDFYESLYELTSLNCTKQSRLNYLTTLLWSYHVPSADDDPKLFQGLPQIQAERLGAYPQALELAFRIRNLEYIVNEQPKNQGVCLDPNVEFCQESISNYETSSNPAFERLIKAFYSGYRNLGNHLDEEMKRSFTLKELSPVEYRDSNPRSLSNILIPVDKQVKYYLDLKLYLNNIVLFYSSFVANDQPGSVAQCDMTKTGLPIPGFPLGFIKNPDLITYYAVSGEAYYKGLFHPFTKPMKLIAYSVAKPFGGRIGPQLFQIEQEALKVRTIEKRSANFVLGLDFSSLKNPFQPSQLYTSNNYMPGLPLPFNNEFFVNNPVHALGGTTSLTKFYIPNMMYDFTNSNYSLVNILPLTILRPSEIQEIKDGLYLSTQFNLLRKLLNTEESITSDLIEKAIDQVRSPTTWDQLNYLIPTSHTLHEALKINHFGLTPLTDKKFLLSAPLYETPLYPNKDILIQSIHDFIQSQIPSVETYILALKKMRDAILSSATGSNQQPYLSSAEMIYDSNTKPSCKSLAGSFLYFYTGDDSLISADHPCPLSFKERLFSYWSQNLSLDLKKHHIISYEANLAQSKKYFSAFHPTLNQGVASDGSFIHPFTGVEEQTSRNFYSVKFISLDDVLQTSKAYNENLSNESIYFEGSSSDSTRQKFFLNFLKETPTKKNSKF